LEFNSGGLAHCRLHANRTGSAVRHQTVQEIWYRLSGQGEIWRKSESESEVTRLEPGICVSIPVGTSFQFRNIGNEPLELMIATMPRWPGQQEAVAVQGLWIREPKGLLFRFRR
jgi:mannose-6-phosphate isomerase-like protein (cupin superfamily)